VDTIRLRNIQYPSSVARLLTGLVSHVPLVGEDDCEVRSARALPAALRQLVTVKTVSSKTLGCGRATDSEDGRVALSEGWEACVAPAAPELLTK
jgi:hypothetical protein